MHQATNHFLLHCCLLRVPPIASLTLIQKSVLSLSSSADISLKACFNRSSSSAVHIPMSIRILSQPGWAFITTQAPRTYVFSRWLTYRSLQSCPVRPTSAAAFAHCRPCVDTALLQSICKVITDYEALTGSKLHRRHSSIHLDVHWDYDPFARTCRRPVEASPEQQKLGDTIRGCI
jgi:hypothetical protein